MGYVARTGYTRPPVSAFLIQRLGICERPADADPECITSPTLLTPALDPEPEEHAGHDGHEREPHQREAHAHQIGHGAPKNAIDASRRPGPRSDVPAGYLVDWFWSMRVRAFRLFLRA